MRKSKFSETQIVEMLKDAESGVPVADLLRKHSVSKATFFKWRSKYGGASVADVEAVPRSLDNLRLMHALAEGGHADRSAVGERGLRNGASQQLSAALSDRR
jgi:putative transposase